MQGKTLLFLASLNQTCDFIFPIEEGVEEIC
jgi:hypothetical protein